MTFWYMTAVIFSSHLRMTMKMMVVTAVLGIFPCCQTLGSLPSMQGGRDYYLPLVGNKAKAWRGEMVGPNSRSPLPWSQSPQDNCRPLPTPLTV